MVYQCDVIPSPATIPFLPQYIREEWKLEQLKEYCKIIYSIADNKEYQMIGGILFKQEEMAERIDDEKRKLAVVTHTLP
jgi:hypothetical protein